MNSGMISIQHFVKKLWTLIMDDSAEIAGVASTRISEGDWEIYADKCLIHHQSGFRAEFRDTAIYSILNFPYEATIQDIRNWVKQAEYQLIRFGGRASVE